MGDDIENNEDLVSTLGQFPAKYLGTATIDKLHVGNDLECQKSIRSAAQRVKKMGVDKQKVLIHVNTTDIRLVDEVTRDPIVSTPIEQVLYSGRSPTSASEFVLVFQIRTGVYHLHLFITRDPPSRVTAAIRQSFQALKDDLNMVPSAPIGPTPVNAWVDEKGPTPMDETSFGGTAAANRRASAAAQRANVTYILPEGTEQWVFDAFFMGTVAIDSASKISMNTVHSAFEMYAQQAFEHEPAYQHIVTFIEVAVSLIVTPESVRVVERLSGEPIDTYFMKRIIFTCIVDHSKKSETACLVVKDDSLGRRNCLFFGFESGKGPEFTFKLNESFKKLIAEEKTVENPFKVIDEARDPVTGDLAKKQIHRGSLQPIKPIGAGQFGQVYLAKQHFPPKTNLAPVTRAVKLLRSAATAEDKHEFVLECEMMCLLDHPNLVKLIGVAVQQKPWLCVLEFMDYGDLRSVVQACQEKGLVLYLFEQLHWACQLANGMGFMSSKRLVHMDLAARNCLLGPNNFVKVADFGLTRKFDEGKDHLLLKEQKRLPIKWVAPEGLAKKIFSEHSDVWSYGVVLWEIFCYGETPYSETLSAEVPRKLKEGFRLRQPKGVPDEVYEVMCHCWEYEREDRPGFDEIKASLVPLVKEYLLDVKRDIGLCVTQAHIGGEGEAK